MPGDAGDSVSVWLRDWFVFDSELWPFGAGKRLKEPRYALRACGLLLRLTPLSLNTLRIVAAMKVAGR